MKKLSLKLIRFYQKYLNFNGFLFRVLFLTDKACRFSPTCSQYTLEAIEKYGVVKGTRMGLLRILRCHPWSAGGYDPVK